MRFRAMILAEFAEQFLDGRAVQEITELSGKPITVFQRSSGNLYIHYDDAAVWRALKINQQKSDK